MRLYLRAASHHPLAFVDEEGHRLLDVDILARRARQDGEQRMPVIRRGHHDSLDVLVLVHLPEIAVALGVRVSDDTRDLRPPGACRRRTGPRRSTSSNFLKSATCCFPINPNPMNPTPMRSLAPSTRAYDAAVIAVAVAAPRNVRREVLPRGSPRVVGLHVPSCASGVEGLCRICSFSPDESIARRARSEGRDSRLERSLLHAISIGLRPN